MSALELSPSPEADRVVMGLRATAVIGLALARAFAEGTFMREDLAGMV